MKLPFVSLLFLVLVSCASSRYVEPLEKGQVAVGASFGGPVISFGGAPVPLPLTNLECGYGIDSNLTLFGAWHTTAAFFGNAQIDAGVTYKFLNQDRFIPNVSVSPSFNFIYNFQEKTSRFWPILDVNAYWNYGKRSNYFYVGINNYFDLNKKIAHEQPQNHNWVFSPQIGHVLKGKKQRGQLFTEFKFLAPYVENTNSFVPYLSTFGKWGATGFYIGYRFIIK